MKSRFLFTAALAITFFPPLLSAQDDEAAAEPNAARKDGSYALGARFASQFREGEIVVDQFVAGFRDQLGDSDLRLSEEALAEAFNALQQSIQVTRAASAAEEGQGNLEAAEAFLAQNKTKEGVKSTESGLQYIVVEEGKGSSPSATDKVKAHYHGTFLDGEVFDSSTERGEPIETVVQGVIPGWQEGLQLMNEGAKYRFFIHPELAYGAEGRGRIPPNSLLIFDVELLDIMKVEAVTPPVAIPPRPQE